MLADDSNTPEDEPPRLYHLPPSTTMYSYPNTEFVPQAHRPKRRQVKNACTNCQKACKKCDDARPCLRCVKYGVSEACVDSKRKERKKGVPRGPYKKRDGKEHYQLQPYYQPQVYTQQPQYVISPHHNLPALVGTMFHRHGSFENQANAMNAHHG